MALTTTIKSCLNRMLSAANLRLETLTASRKEEARLDQLARAGHFDKRAFPVPHVFDSCNPAVILDELALHQERFATFADPKLNELGYSFANDYFSSPDAEVLYAVVRKFRPARIVEVGSGNSTRITRQAIKDGKINTRLTCIDPHPRKEVTGLCDELIRTSVGCGQTLKAIDDLQPGDVLFIDSSHEVRTGNDVVHLFLCVLPRLPAGVLIHIHDVYLPYDYPRDWIRVEGRNWNEQHLAQAMLGFGDAFSVIWPGHYLQRTMAGFQKYFPHVVGHTACSLWLTKAR